MMKTKRLIVILCCLVQILFGTVAYAEKIPVNKNWKEADGERSLYSSPILMKEGNMLLIQSDKVLENLFITITSEDGRQVYLELSNVKDSLE